jgi:hypothetical protein
MKLRVGPPSMKILLHIATFTLISINSFGQDNIES